MGSVDDSTKVSEGDGKTITKLRSFNIQGMLTGCDQFEELDEVALIKAVIKKMGHEVRLSVQAVLHKAHLLSVMLCVDNHMEEKAHVIMFEFPIM